MIYVGIRVSTYTAGVQYNSNIINDYIMISGHAPVRMRMIREGFSAYEI